MDEYVAKLTTPEECDQFVLNVAAKFPNLAIEATRRGVELREKKHDAKTIVEQECLQAIYAYEQVMTARKGRKSPASRTWQMIKRDGIIPAVEKVVSRPVDAQGYSELANVGLKDLSFEAIVIRHPESFSVEAYARCAKRLSDYEQR